MNLETTFGVPIDSKFMFNYCKHLVNSFFKILPIFESVGTPDYKDGSLETYIRSLQVEITGCERFISNLDGDRSLIILLSILQYMYENRDMPHAELKREVFKAIAICNKLKKKYGGSGDWEVVGLELC